MLNFNCLEEIQEKVKNGADVLEITIAWRRFIRTTPVPPDGMLRLLYETAAKDFIRDDIGSIALDCAKMGLLGDMDFAMKVGRVAVAEHALSVITTCDEYTVTIIFDVMRFNSHDYILGVLSRKDTKIIDRLSHHVDTRFLYLAAVKPTIIVAQHLVTKYSRKFIWTEDLLCIYIVLVEQLFFNFLYYGNLYGVYVNEALRCIRELLYQSKIKASVATHNIIKKLIKTISDVACAKGVALDNLILLHEYL